MNLNIDVAIFIGFLTLNLVVGLSYGRKVKTIEDYALGGRNFSTAALVSTIVATFLTGSGFFIDLSKTYSDGITYVIPSLAWCLQFLLVGVFLIPRMGEFMGSLSVAEVMGNLYDKRVRLITAVSGILWNVGGIAVQFKVFGNLFNYFLGIPGNYAILIASAIIITYSAFGGIKAVTYTDILQFFTFGFVIPMIGIIVWNDFQSLGLNITDALENSLFDYRSLFDLKGEKLLSFTFLIFYFVFPTIGPVHFQRISMGRNIKQVKSAFIIATILCLFITLAIMWIPFLILNIKPGMESNEITSFIINNYTQAGLKGLIIIGISAMAMSSADSFINGSAVLFAHDLKEVLNIKVNNLVLSKLFSLVLGGVAVYLALSTNDLLSMIMTTASLYMPVVSMPLLLAIMGFRGSTKSALIAMAAGFSTVVLFKILKIQDVIIPAMFVNLIFLLGSHYLLKQPGGWVGIKDRTYLDAKKKERRRTINKLIELFKNTKLLDLFKKTAPQNEMMYTWLGIYFIFFTFSTMYSTHIALNDENGKVILTIYQIMMCTGTVIAMYPIWPPRIKHEIIVQVAWNIVIFYMLVFFSCFFVMLSDFGHLQFAIFTMNIIITALLVGWKLSLIMIAIGFYSSVQFYKYYSGLGTLDVSFGSPQFIFMYSLMLIGSALVIFLRPRQAFQILVEEKVDHLNGRIDSQERQLKEALSSRNEIIRNISHEYNAPMAGITTSAQILWESYEKLNDQQRKDTAKNIFQSFVRLECFDANLASLARLSKADYVLNKEQIDLTSLLYNRIEVCRKLYEKNKNDREFILNIQDEIMFYGDKHYLTQLLDNLIINSISYCKEGNIVISLNSRKESINFSIKDDGIGIPTEELKDVFGEFMISSKTRTSAGGRGIGLALCKRVIDVHGGDIKAESDGEKGAAFTFTIPK